MKFQNEEKGIIRIIDRSHQNKEKLELRARKSLFAHLLKINRCYQSSEKLTPTQRSINTITLSHCFQRLDLPKLKYIRQEAGIHQKKKNIFNSVASHLGPK